MIKKPLDPRSLKKDPANRKAAALFYDGKTAPTVTAAGHGELAEEIIELARQNGIPLFENADLLTLLMEIGLGEEIPETLYLCIAQIIAFAYKIQGKFPEGWDPEQQTQHLLPKLES
jgi:flagellar biosynthesis protein